MSSRSDNLEPVEILADDFMRRKRGGGQPTIEEYCANHPELADDIREVFPALVVMEQVAPDSVDLESPAETVASPDRQIIETIGDYRILREIGRGGMGVVYEAEQESLGRRVALKVLPRLATGDEKAQLRFQREARAAAKMHHTNIVPVFDVGFDDKYSYYAMQLIQGQGLDQVVGDLRDLRSLHMEGNAEVPKDQSRAVPEPSIALSLVKRNFSCENLHAEADVANDPALAETIFVSKGSTVSAVLPGKSDISTAESNRTAYFRSVAEIGCQTSRALAYAHARGITHRDIKPSNLILDTAGVVWVADFGLALTGDSAMTQTGDILGTIRYMSPERFRGQCDHRADVYSLGLTLYEMLVLKPAFESPDRLKLIEMVSHSEVTAPRSIDSRIPRDLETIVLKASDKDPRRRYQSADELADDLQRYINDEPIHARRISTAERFARWTRRNKALAASLLGTAALVLVMLVGSMTAAAHYRLQEESQRTLVVERTALAQKNAELADSLKLVIHEKEAEAQNALAARDDADRARKEVISEQEITQRNLYFSQINMAQLAGDSGDTARQFALLSACRELDAQHQLRNWEWYYLLGSHEQAVAEFDGQDTLANCARFSPDGSKIAVAGQSVEIWDRITGRRVRSLAEHSGLSFAVAWSSDGKRLATGGSDSSVRIWDAETGEQVLAISGHQGAVQSVEWSPDNRQIASAAIDGTARVWDVQTGRQVCYHAQGTGTLLGVAWHPTGSQIASVGGEPDVRVWNSQTGALTTSLHGHHGAVTAVAWHPDGQRLITGAAAGEFFLWDVETGVPQVFSGHNRDCGMAGLGVSPDGRLLATHSTDQMIKIHEIDSRDLVRTIHSSSPFPNIDWHPGSSEIVSGGGDGRIRIWNVTDQREGSLFLRHVQPILVTDFSPDGRWLLSASLDGIINISDARTGKLVRRLSGHEDSISVPAAARFSPDGRRVAVAGQSQNVVVVWDANSGELIRKLGSELSAAPDMRGIDALDWSPDARHIAVTIKAAPVLIWNLKTEQSRSLPPESSGATSLAFSPGAEQELIVTVHEDGRIGFWDANALKLLHQRDFRGKHWGFTRFSPKGDRLVVTGRRQSLPFRRPQGEIQVWQLPGGGPPLEGQQPLSLNGHVDQVTAADFTPDGCRLATSSDDNTVRLWDVRSLSSVEKVGRQLLLFAHHRSGVTTVNFSPDGMKLATGGSDYAIHMLDAADGYMHELSPRLLESLDRRISQGEATAEDYRRRASIMMRQAKWSDAAIALDRVAELDKNATWFKSDIWMVDTPYPGDLDMRYMPETFTTVSDLDLLRALGGDPDDTAAKRHWRIAPVKSTGPTRSIEFSSALGGMEPRIGYALLRIYAVQDQNLALLFGADDRCRLWHNSQIVRKQVVHPRGSGGPYFIDLRLESGWNTLLFKIVNEPGIENGHGLTMMVRDDSIPLTAGLVSAANYEQASAWVDRAVERAPNDPARLLKRAELRWKSGRKTPADEDLENVLKLPLSESSLRRTRAQTLVRMGRIEDAVKDLNHLLNLIPDDIDARKQRGDWQVELGQLEEGMADLDHARKLNPDEHFVACRLAAVVMMLDKEDDYRKMRTELLDRWSDDQDLTIAERIAKASLLMPSEGEDLQRAVQMARRAGASPRGAGYYDYYQLVNGLGDFRLGQHLATAGDQVGSERAFTSALQAFRRMNARLMMAPSLASIVHACEVMIFYRRGDTNSLARALARMDGAERKLDRNAGRFNQGWHDEFVARILIREARRHLHQEAYDQIERAEQLLTDGETDRSLAMVPLALIGAPENQELLDRAQTMVAAASNENLSEGESLADSKWLDVLSQAITQMPDSLLLRRERMQQAIFHERWDLAAEDYRARLRLIGDFDSFHSMRAAALSAFHGDRDSVEKVGRELIEHADVRSAYDLERLTKVNCMLPNLTDIDSLPISELEDAAANSGHSASLASWCRAALAIAAYRQADYDTASNHADFIVASPDIEDIKLQKTLVWPIRAMVLYHHGDSTAARHALVECDKAMETMCQRRPDGTIVGSSLFTESGSFQHDILIAEVLRREAETLINGKETLSESNR